MFTLLVELASALASARRPLRQRRPASSRGALLLAAPAAPSCLESAVPCCCFEPAAPSCFESLRCPAAAACRRRRPLRVRGALLRLHRRGAGAAAARTAAAHGAARAAARRRSRRCPSCRRRSRRRCLLHRPSPSLARWRPRLTTRLPPHRTQQCVSHDFLHELRPSCGLALVCNETASAWFRVAAGAGDPRWQRAGTERAQADRDSSPVLTATSAFSLR